MEILRNKNLVNNYMRWILFGVLLVVAPSLFNMGYRMVVGYSVSAAEYIPDMLIAVLSVACNLLSSCVDSSKRIAHFLRWLLGIILGTIAAGCWGLFFVMRFIPEDIIPKKYYEGKAENLFFAAIVIISVCTVLGVTIEVYDTKKKQRVEVKG